MKGWGGPVAPLVVMAPLGVGIWMGGETLMKAGGLSSEHHQSLQALGTAVHNLGDAVAGHGRQLSDQQTRLEVQQQEVSKVRDGCAQAHTAFLGLDCHMKTHSSTIEEMQGRQNKLSSSFDVLQRQCEVDHGDLQALSQNNSTTGKPFNATPRPLVDPEPQLQQRKCAGAM